MSSSAEAHLPALAQWPGPGSDLGLAFTLSEAQRGTGGQCRALQPPVTGWVEDVSWGAVGVALAVVPSCFPCWFPGFLTKLEYFLLLATRTPAEMNREARKARIPAPSTVPRVRLEPRKVSLLLPQPPDWHPWGQISLGQEQNGCKCPRKQADFA